MNHKPIALRVAAAALSFALLFAYVGYRAIGSGAAGSSTDSPAHRTDLPGEWVVMSSSKSAIPGSFGVPGASSGPLDIWSVEHLPGASDESTASRKPPPLVMSGSKYLVMTGIVPSDLLTTDPVVLPDPFEPPQLSVLERVPLRVTLPATETKPEVTITLDWSGKAPAPESRPKPKRVEPTSEERSFQKMLMSSSKSRMIDRVYPDLFGVFFGRFLDENLPPPDPPEVFRFK